MRDRRSGDSRNREIKRVSHFPPTAPTRRRWHAQDDGWAVLFGLLAFLKGAGADWGIIDDLVEKEEFGGLWWW